MGGIGTISFGVTLLAPKRGSIGRLCQVRFHASPFEFFYHITPTRASLQGESDIPLGGETGEPLAEMIAVGRSDLAPFQLA
jgi:hypothetical protein